MPIKINDGFLRLQADSQVTATARRRADGWREVSYRPRFCDRDHAITTAAITELLASGRGNSDPVASALRGELR
jgi:hypothetical protein